MNQESSRYLEIRADAKSDVIRLLGEQVDSGERVTITLQKEGDFYRASLLWPSEEPRIT
jgi:hypothetical protein